MSPRVILLDDDRLHVSDIGVRGYQRLGETG